ncbi:S8 family peptidase [Paucibacter soli]|uniref:S8 family peptidase n=1 Tax=Paucibacter soli TaxID=3133433 RepID=UPI0030A4BD91
MKYVFLLSLLALASTTHAMQGADAAPTQDLVLRASSSSGSTDRLIVKYRDGNGAYPTARGRLAAMVAANRQGVAMTHFRQTAHGAQVFKLNRRLGAGELEAMAGSLRAGDPNIEYVEPDRLMQPALVPNDSYYAQQWSLFDASAGIRAPAAWDRAKGSGVTVAVIDTGVRPHADFAARLLPGYDFITSSAIAGDGGGREADAYDPGDYTTAGQCGSGTPAQDSSWHGTHVAGIVAAGANNGIGVAGVAFGARILPLRALGRCGGYTSDIADAIVWAAGGSVSGVPANANPARVINLSLGGSGACGITTQNAINSARARGAVVVVAAGNDNVDAGSAAPANCSGVISVAATGKSGGKASYSNYGSKVTLSAPGGDAGAGILSTYNSGSTVPGSDAYAWMMGTSMATPMVSGVAALMLSVNKSLTPDQLAAMLKSSARAFPASCAGCGAGLVDANAAVALAISGGSSLPSTPPAPSSTNTVTDIEPNNSVASAQVLTGLAVNVSGTLGSSSDEDFFRVSVPAGKTLVANLSSGAGSGFGIGAYSAAGQQLLLLTAVLGQQSRLSISNPGTAAAPVVLRVLRSVGAAGAYTLSISSN